MTITISNKVQDQTKGDESMIDFKYIEALLIRLIGKAEVGCREEKILYDDLIHLYKTV